MAKRSFAIDHRLFGAVILAGVVGCQSASPTVDPFAAYGQTRVPPPATGTIGQGSYGQAPLTPINPPGYPAPSPSATPPALRDVPSLSPTLEQGTPPSSTGAAASGTRHEPDRATGQLRESDDLVWLPPTGVVASNPYGQVGYNQPAYGPPTNSQPVYSQPMYSQPNYSPPTYSQPTYSQPTYSQPTYSQPTYSEPVYSPPTYNPLAPMAPPRL